jgi:hypothetical protein
MKGYGGFHHIHKEVVKAEKRTGKDFSMLGKGSTQKIFMFKNGYGASVVKGCFTFNLDELAVLKFDNPVSIRSKKKRLKKKALKKAGDYKLLYNTPIADDIKRYIDQNELNMDLTLISKFKAGQY